MGTEIQMNTERFFRPEMVLALFAFLTAQPMGQIIIHIMRHHSEFFIYSL